MQLSSLQEGLVAIFSLHSLYTLLEKAKMSGGGILLFMLLGAMYIGAQAQVYVPPIYDPGW